MTEKLLNHVSGTTMNFLMLRYARAAPCRREFVAAMLANAMKSGPQSPLPRHAFQIRATTMAVSHSLEGLMKWLRRDEWRDAFDEVLARHLGPACDKADIEVDELSTHLGADWFMTLWGCAFEDFLTREIAGGRNIVDDYLKRRGWTESASTKAYMAALRTSAMSVYEVSGIVPGESLLARDLVRGGEPVLVSEHSATKSLKPWDRIAARMVPVGSKTILGGGLLPFERDASEKLLTALRNAARRARKGRDELAGAFGRDGEDAAIAEAFSDTMLLRSAAPLFTTIWLSDTLDRVLNPPKLEIYNTEGDDLVFCTMRYPLAASTDPAAIRAALCKVTDLRQENETFWNWVRLEPAPRQSRSAKGTPSPGLTFRTTLEDDSIVLGTVEIRDKTVILAVNSEARAGKGRELLGRALGHLVGPPVVERQTLAELQSSRPSRASKGSADALPPDVQKTVVHASLDKHYRHQLDAPIPMLGNLTPRTAARTEKGREKLVAWLKTLENQTARHANHGDPMADYDFSWVWRELGIESLRR